MLAGRPALTVARIGVGSKPIPGDGEPVVGAVTEIPGLFVLFTHSGATVGLILGELLAEEISTGGPAPVLAPFRIERFATKPRSGASTPARGHRSPIPEPRGQALLTPFPMYARVVEVGTFHFLFPRTKRRRESDSDERVDPGS
ncbi:hypothetical protein MF406_03960 [Georgenia sp. TF02-10]|uniref:hypothetical protein n=1 Tax=Georgenia sp. TF02-10 TaxID=2917725 RepID=UPI001FA78A99|nr:hypothetical protein [Georgenia sp. TF02-10]UNX55430.1 hypothetical protein MF406_03960 [Georgenia sp. TF02-10]